MPRLTPDSLEEFLVEEILDSRRRGRRWQYLVQWVGYNSKHDHWLSGSTLEDCEALDRWLELQDTGEATR